MQNFGDLIDPYGLNSSTGSSPRRKYSQAAIQKGAQTEVPPPRIGDYSEDRSPTEKTRDGVTDLVNPVAHGEFVAQALRNPKELLNDPLSMLFPHLGPAIGSLF